MMRKKMNQENTFYNQSIEVTIKTKKPMKKSFKYALAIGIIKKAVLLIFLFLPFINYLNL